MESESHGNPPSMHVIVAVAQNGVIGSNNTLPWRLSKDLQRFKRLTMGHTLIMGRKTFDSIGRVLPGRRSIVLSRQLGLQIPGCDVLDSIENAMQSVGGRETAFVIGGAQIYQSAMPLAQHLHLTHVMTTVAGDAHFAWSPQHWSCVEQEYVPADEKNEWPSLYQHWVRTTP